MVVVLFGIGAAVGWWLLNIANGMETRTTATCKTRTRIVDLSISGNFGRLRHNLILSSLFVLASSIHHPTIILSTTLHAMQGFSGFSGLDREQSEKEGGRREKRRRPINK